MDPKNAIGQKIRALREAKGYSQTRLGKLAFGYKDGEENSAQIKITRIETGKKKVYAEELINLSTALQVSIMDIVTDRFSAVDVPARLPSPIPVILWNEVEMFAEKENLLLPFTSRSTERVHSMRRVGPNAFALRVEDDRIAPRFLPGDIVIVDPAIPCQDGDPCVALLNGQTVFQTFKETKDAIILEPANRKYPEVVIKKDSQVDFRLIGNVVDLIANL